jgi:hypothetical protein
LFVVIKQQIPPQPLNALEYNSVEFCININANLITKSMEKPQIRLLALEIIYTGIPKRRVAPGLN